MKEKRCYFLMVWWLVRLLIVSQVYWNLAKSQIDYEQRKFTWQTIMHDYLGDTVEEKTRANFPFLVDKQTNRLIEPFKYLNFLEAVSPNSSYLKQTSAEAHLYAIEREADYENRHKRDHSYTSDKDKLVSGEPVANKATCRRQLKWLHKTVAKNPNDLFRNGYRDLMLWMDSFGRPEADTYRGNAFWYGSYEECLETKIDTRNYELQTKQQQQQQQTTPAFSELKQGEEVINMRYCLGKIVAKSWPKNDTILPKTTIKLGLCLPETCDSSSIEDTSQRLQIQDFMLIQFASIYKSRFELVDMFCLPDERSPLRQLSRSAYLFIAFWSIWLLLIVLATRKCLNRHQQGQDGQKSGLTLTESIIDSLDLTKSIQSLVALPRAAKIDLNGISFIKSITTFMVIWGHCFYFNIIVYKTTQQSSDYSGSPWSQVFNSFTLANDTFFVVGAMLWAYGTMKELQYKNQDPIELLKPLSWIKSNLDKTLRLAPVFMMGFWFSNSISVYLGSGPSWDYGVDKDSYVGQCMRNDWYKSIIYLASDNYYPSPRCNEPTWYLVTFVRLLLVMPIVLYLLIKLPKWRLSIVTLLVGITTIRSAITHAKDDKLDALSLLLYRVKALEIGFKYSQPVYVSAIYRMSSLVIGVLGGVYLYDYDVGHIKEWPKCLRGWPFALSQWMQLLVFFAPCITRYFSDYVQNASDTMNIILIFAIQLAWSINSLILFLRISTDLASNNWFMKFVSHPVWAIVSRLTYCVYIFHAEIIFMLIRYETKGTISNYKILLETSTALFVSSLLSIFLYLTLEAPMDRLLRLMTKPKWKAAPKVKAS